MSLEKEQFENASISFLPMAPTIASSVISVISTSSWLSMMTLDPPEDHDTSLPTVVVNDLTSIFTPIMTLDPWTEKGTVISDSPSGFNPMIELLPTAKPAELGFFTSSKIIYLISEVIVALLAVMGNAMVIAVFTLERKLRRLTNYYIVSLALADLLVGLVGVPCAILTYLGLPKELRACLFMLSFLMMLCTVSIFCLVAVSVDRYWAILHPLLYSRIMTGKLA
ncbi:unnamed protein product, partial [Meganyctiphanes norvegica]